MRGWAKRLRRRRTAGGSAEADRGAPSTWEARARAAEAELARVSRRLEDITALSGDWLWETDSGLRFTYFSERIRDVLGYAPEELYGRHRDDLVCDPCADSADTDGAWSAHLDDVRNHRPFHGIRCTMYDADGRAHRMSASGRPVYGEDGRFLGYRGTATDVTAERDLQHTGQTLQTILESMSEGVSVVDGDLTMTAFNRRFLDVLDFPADRFAPGDPFEKFIRFNAERGDYGPGDVEEQVRERLELARRFEAHRFTRTRPDGTVLQIEGTPMPGGGFVTLYRDVTEQARAEAELRASEKRFRDIAEISADWFWETDTQQRFTYHSRAQDLESPDLLDGKLLGRSRGEVMAEIGASPDPTPEVTRAVAAGAAFHDLEYQFEHPTLGTRWVRFSGLPVHDDAGSLTGYRGIGRDITADKRAERELRQKEKRYRSIFLNAVEGMYRTAADGRYVEVNQALARMHGCDDPERFVERFRSGHAVYVDPAVRQHMIEAVEKDGFARSVEGLAYRADGSTFPFSESIWAVYDDDGGGLIGFEGIVEDTSAREAARHKLETSEQRYRIVSEMTSDMVYSYDVAANGEARVDWVAGSLKGISPRRLTDAGASCWSEVIHPDDASILDRRLDDIQAGRSPIDEIRIYGEDGDIRWIRLHGRAEFDPDDGRLIRILGAASDITAEKQVEGRLRDSAALLQQAIKIADIGHWQWDEVNEKLVYCSPELAAILGMDVEEYLRELGTYADAARYIHPDDRGQALAAMESAREHVQPYEVTYRFLRKDGAVRYGRELGEPLLDHHGRLVGSTGTLQDVTEAKEAEAALRAAKEAAELANRTKGEFLANMSHELRTPLNAIIGFAEVLQREVFGALGSRNREYAADIRNSGEHLLEIINEILDVSKAEAGMIDLVEDTVVLNEVVAACFRLLRHKAEANRVELRDTVSEALPRIRADERRLKQVLLNLLSNAVKFTEAGGRITVAAKLEAEGALLVQVSDTGIGISAQELDQVMEPFSQTGSAMSRKHEGTGLGLPLSRALVEQHDGEFWLDSTRGKGTTANLRLPASRVLTEVSAVAPAEVPN